MKTDLFFIKNIRENPCKSAVMGSTWGIYNPIGKQEASWQESKGASRW